MRPVEIVDYDASWPILFAAERDGLLALLDDLVDAIHHIGSTAVPGLAAKPKIDLDVVLRSDDIIPDAVARVRATGVYADHGDPYGDGRWTFTRGRGQGVRLYVCGPGNRAHCERLRFRDRLRAHPEDCAAYEALKRRLAVEAHGDFAAYANGKSAFVSNILGKASLARSKLRS